MVKRQLLSVAFGRSEHVAVDLDDASVDLSSVVEEVTARLEPYGPSAQLLIAAFMNSKVADGVVERLGAKSIRDRLSAVRICAALRMTEAAPWLAPLLGSRDPSTVDAVARALGRIGGERSATALLVAIQRRGPSRRLVCALAQAAPDLFVEVALRESQKPTVRPALAVVAGLRRRRTAVSQLIVLLERGTRRERVISCRALGWIGAATAIPLIGDALDDRDWKIRVSAAKALGALQAAACRPRLVHVAAADPNPRVRHAASLAVARIDRSSARGVTGGA